MKVEFVSSNLVLAMLMTDAYSTDTFWPYKNDAITPS